jgi:hypothetical protein
MIEIFARFRPPQVPRPHWWIQFTTACRTKYYAVRTHDFWLRSPSTSTGVLCCQNSLPQPVKNAERLQGGLVGLDGLYHTPPLAYRIILVHLVSTSTSYSVQSKTMEKPWLPNGSLDISQQSFGRKNCMTTW